MNDKEINYLNKDKDEHAWLLHMSESIKKLNLPHMAESGIIEYLIEMAKDKQRAVKSHLRILLIHLLKWNFQKENRSKSWKVSILNSRNNVLDLLEDQPSLKRFFKEMFMSDDLYKSALKIAIVETGMDESSFPKKNPFSIEQILDEDFFDLN